MSERYLVIFLIENSEERKRLTSWLEDRLKPPHQLEVSENSVIIVSPTKDDSHKVAVWIYHRNPVGKLKYSVRGLREGKLIYCRSHM